MSSQSMESSPHELCRRCRDLTLGKALTFSEWSRRQQTLGQASLSFVDQLTAQDRVTGTEREPPCFLCKTFPQEPGWLCSVIAYSEVTSAPETSPPAVAQLAYRLRGSSSTLPLGLICVDSTRFSQRFSADLPLKWLDHCRSHHDCGAVNNSIPLVHSINLIDCQNRCTVPNDGSEVYVALSYVWGKLDRSELQGQSHGRLPPRLPRTIEDAIQVTKMLGFQYLWIDAYCIDHASSTSVHQQMGQMDAIYGRAQLTLVAAAGEDAESGLPNVDSCHAPYSKRENVYLVQSRTIFPREAINTSRWATRGWTYQEALLSCRRLVFTDEHVYFECKKMSCWRAKELLQASDPARDIDLLEDELKTCNGRGPILWKTYIGDKGGAGAQKAYVWKSIKEYTQRQLTYSSDSLNGFQGILSHYRELTGGKLLDIWGLPYEHGDLDSMLASLCWRHAANSASLYGVHITRRTDFPSWSWAGWSGAILPLHFPDARGGIMELISTKEGARGPDAILEVSAVFAKPEVVRQSILHGAVQFYADAETHQLDLSREVIENEAECRVAPIFDEGDSTWALVLQRLTNHDSYTRIGLVYLTAVLNRTGFVKHLIEGQPREVILLE